MPDAVTGYKLTESDKALIRALRNGGSNISAVHFDGQVLVDMVLMKRDSDRRVIEAGYMKRF